MLQKTISIGNSIGIIIPKNVLKEKNIKVGDNVQVSIESTKNVRKTSLTPQFLEWVDNYIESNRPALVELAGK